MKSLIAVTLLLVGGVSIASAQEAVYRMERGTAKKVVLYKDGSWKADTAWVHPADVLSNWNRLEMKMTKAQVLKLLGEPLKSSMIMKQLVLEYHNGGKVYINIDTKKPFWVAGVAAWISPDYR